MTGMTSRSEIKEFFHLEIRKKWNQKDFIYCFHYIYFVNRQLCGMLWTYLLKEVKSEEKKWIAADVDCNKSESQKEVSDDPFPLLLNSNGPLLPISLPQVFQLTCNYFALWGGFGASVVPSDMFVLGMLNTSIMHLQVSCWQLLLRFKQQKSSLFYIIYIILNTENITMKSEVSLPVNVSF